MRINIPEGSDESFFLGQRFTFGRLGRLELYLSIVLRERRHLLAVGSYNARRAPWYKRIIFARHAAWSTKLVEFSDLYDPYTPDVWYSDGSVHGEPAGYYHRDECEFAYGPFRTREAAHMALVKYCETL